MKGITRTKASQPSSFHIHPSISRRKCHVEYNIQCLGRNAEELCDVDGGAENQFD